MDEYEDIELENIDQHILQEKNEIIQNDETIQKDNYELEEEEEGNKLEEEQINDNINNNNNIEISNELGNNKPINEKKSNSIILQKNIKKIEKPKIMYVKKPHFNESKFRARSINQGKDTPSNIDKGMSSLAHTSEVVEYNEKEFKINNNNNDRSMTEQECIDDMIKYCKIIFERVDGFALRLMNKNEILTFEKNKHTPSARYGEDSISVVNRYINSINHNSHRLEQYFKQKYPNPDEKNGCVIN
jgi:hypothetical protein